MKAIGTNFLVSIGLFISFTAMQFLSSLVIENAAPGINTDDPEKLLNILFLFTAIPTALLCWGLGSSKPKAKCKPLKTL